MKRDELRALGITRVALGAVLLLRTTPLANLYPSPLAHVHGPLLGWPAHDWQAPWLGLALPYGLVAALCVVRTAAALCFTLGVAPRASGVLAACCAFAVLSQDAFAFVFTFYILFVGVLLVAVCESGSACALVRARPAPGPTGLMLVRAFVASVYAWSGVAKLRVAWLDGTTLAALRDGHFLRGPVADFLLATPSMRVGAAWSVVIVEVALGPLLLARKTRLAGVALALAMHGAYELTAHPDVMGPVMAALLCAFVPWRYPERVTSAPGSQAPSVA